MNSGLSPTHSRRLRQDRYRTGWNDLAHGLLNWTGSDKYATPQEWAAGMKTVAEGQTKQFGDDGYYAGVVAAANEFARTGKIYERKEPTCDSLHILNPRRGSGTTPSP